MPIGTAPVMPDELAGGAATIPQQPTMPAGNPPVAAVKQPSLFMRILSGALLGMGAGMAAERPEQGFAAGWGAVESARDRQLKQQLLMQESQRQQEQLGLQKRQIDLEAERVGFERQRLGLETRKADEQTGFNILNKLRLSKEIDQMPDEQKRKWTETMANYIQSLTQAGARIKFVTDDSTTSMTAVMQEFGPPRDTKVRVPGKDSQSAPVEKTIQQSPLFNQLMPIHDEKNNRILWFERPDDVKKYSADQPDIVLPSGRHIPVAGRPISLVDSQFHLEGVVEAANINAAAEDRRYNRAKEAAEKPLSMKEALQQARQEIAPLIMAEEGSAESRRKFKNQADITKAIDTRARELLDLDAQLRRSGLTQTANVLGVLGALKLQRQHGASDIQLKQQIAQAASLGQLSTVEIITLYNQLGLVPSAQPQPAAKPTSVPPIPWSPGMPLPPTAPLPASFTERVPAAAEDLTPQALRTPSPSPVPAH